MLKYPCLVLDHDDTVVQSMKTLSYPFFCYILDQFRPGERMSLNDYVQDCHELGFARLCVERFGYTEEELADEHEQWMDYVRQHIPDPYPGIREILHKQKAEGGLICVVSHSCEENILRDYDAHFGLRPDAIYGWDLPEAQRKPNAYPLLHIMERYSLKPQDLLVVDDMKLGWKMADAAKVPVAYAGWSGMGIEELDKEMRNLCDFSFNSTKELGKFLFD